MTSKTRKRKQKVLIVHKHESSEGSTILAVLPATKRGRMRAKKIEAEEKSRLGLMGCDEVDIEEHEID